MRPPVGICNVVHYHQPAGQQPGSRVVPPGHELVELLTGGRGWVVTEAGWREVTLGDLIWHAAGERTIARSDEANPYRCLAVLFAVTEEGRRVPRFSRWSGPDEVAAFTREVVRGFLDESLDRDALLAYVYGRCVYQANLWASRAPALDVAPGLVRALAQIENDYAQPLALDDLASAAGWSSSHLHAMFRHHVGSSPHQLLVRRRVRAAQELLATTDAPIKQIAAACGFSNAGALCRRFRQTVGLSPGAYRRQQVHPV